VGFLIVNSESFNKRNATVGISEIHQIVTAFLKVGTLKVGAIFLI